MRWREQDGVRWLEAELPAGRAAFTTRGGGRSAPPFDSLNLGILTGDDPAVVRANRHHLAGAIGLDPERIAIGRQVHGTEVEWHSAPQRPAPFADPGPAPSEVDGHLTDTDDLALLVLVADCLPIALAGEGGVAMVHGGWRGLAAGIVERGVEATAARAAAVGPGIGPCCFEVGDEVAAAFGGLGADLRERRKLDLPGVARRLLERAGVESVEVAELCTMCNPELLFSHRGGGPRTGRQAGIVWRPAG